MLNCFIKGNRPRKWTLPRSCREALIEPGFMAPATLFQTFQTTHAWWQLVNWLVTAGSLLPEVCRQLERLEGFRQESEEAQHEQKFWNLCLLWWLQQPGIDLTVAQFIETALFSFPCLLTPQNGSFALLPTYSKSLGSSLASLVAGLHWAPTTVPGFDAHEKCLIFPSYR